MAVRSGRRALAMLGIVVTGVTMLLGATPASAQVPPGTEAAVVAGGPTAVCPPGSPGALVPGGGTFGAITVTGAGRCTPLAADAEGSYNIAGSFAGFLPFTSECANVGGVVQHHGGVTVPAGTIVNGVAVAVPTTVETVNTPVIFPGGQAAILNQVITTPTSLTRNAIVFANGPIVGQVICGAAAYPLALAGGGETAAPPLTPDALSSDGGSSTGLILVGVGIALAVVAQVVVARRMWHRKGTAAA